MLATVAVPDITTVNEPVPIALTAAVRVVAPLLTFVPAVGRIDFGAVP